jgi:hypothetical protein
MSHQQRFGLSSDKSVVATRGLANKLEKLNDGSLGGAVLDDNA